MSDASLQILPTLGANHTVRKNSLKKDAAIKYDALYKGLSFFERRDANDQVSPDSDVYVTVMLLFVHLTRQAICCLPELSLSKVYSV